jgi:ribosome recycling factor
MYDWKARMQKNARHFAEQLHGIRTGKVHRGVIQTVRVDLQGNAAPISRLGVIKLQRDRILFQPFDRSTVPAIIKALSDSRMSA